jgi:hypothetical protein
LAVLLLFRLSRLLLLLLLSRLLLLLLSRLLLLLLRVLLPLSCYPFSIRSCCRLLLRCRVGYCCCC